MANSINRIASVPSRRIAPPDGLREPLKANIFERMQTSNTQLVPLFPYLGRGAIVPAGALIQGGSGVDYGQFFHANTVDEVVLVFGSSGAFIPTGMVTIGARTHGVNSFLRNQNDSGSFALISITQRQSEEGEQREAFILRCEKCNAELVKIEADVTPPQAENPGADGPALFETISYSARMAEVFNDGDRTCGKCGTINPPFPLDRWGWSVYSAQSATAQAAWRELMTLQQGEPAPDRFKG